MKEASPTVVLNESVVDHSTRVLISLSSFGYSSPSQTALILYGLLNFLRGRDYLYRDQLKDPINNAINFILSTQGEDGLWKDPTYVGVAFPQVQYMRYPRFQESSILGVLGMYHQDIHYYGDRED